jgi:hypothetical protein
MKPSARQDVVIRQLQIYFGNDVPEFGIPGEMPGASLITSLVVGVDVGET